MKLHALFSAALLALGLSGASAQNPVVQIKDAWVRSTVAGQKASGAFMKITAKDGARLVGVASPVAGVAEVHEMKMDGDVMRMRALPALDLPAGREVQFRPGGYHLMLMDLKQPLVAGSQIAVTLVLQDAKGVETRQELTLPVSRVAPGAPAAAAKPSADGGHGSHKH